MKNLLISTIIFILLSPAWSLSAQSTNGNSNPNGRENWFPNRGNVGIGTRTPSEALEVIGNVRVSQTVFAQEIEAVGLHVTTLNVDQDAFIGRHLMVNGNVGIGVNNPSERLEINGNLRVTNSIFGDALTVRQLTATDGVINNSFRVSQKLIVDGLTGLGVNSPTERLEISGNAKITQGLYSDFLNTGDGTYSRNVSVNQNLFVSGKTGLGVASPVEKFEVDGNAKITQGLYSDFLNTGDGIYSRNLTVNQNLFISGKTGLGVASPVEKFEVDGNAKITQGLFSNSLNTGDGLFTRTLRTNQNVIADGSVGIGTSTPSEKLDVIGNAKISQGIFSGSITSGEGLFSSNLRSNQNIIADGSIGVGVSSPTEKLEVAGSAKISQTLFSNSVNATDGQFTGKLNVGQNAVVNGSVGVGVALPTEKLDVLGNIKSSADVIGVNIRAQKGYFNSLESDGNLTINGNVGIGVTSPVEKLEVAGNIKSTGDLIGVNVHANKGYFSSIESNGNLSINGNVGIGVATPTEKLEVAGNIKATQGIFANSIQTNLDLSAGRNLTVTGNVGIGQAPGTDKLSVAGAAYVNGLLTAENLTVKQKLDIKGAFSVAGTLGIGVANPEATLHVNGDGRFEGDVRANKIIVNEIEIAGTPEGPGGGSNVSLENLFVNGTVAIGTTKTTGYKLSVDGKIRAGDDIKVYPSGEWSDFVFGRGYKLRALADVEQYIESHGHLPEIPSAKEVKTNGFDVGAMDAKLLQKIEEVTLYLIELKKENELLKKELDGLKNARKN